MGVSEDIRLSECVYVNLRLVFDVSILPQRTGSEHGAARKILHATGKLYTAAMRVVASQVQSNQRDASLARRLQ